MDSPPSLSRFLKKRGKYESHGDHWYGTNGSVTSYEDIPSGGILNGDTSTDAMLETNRGAVMQALQNLQDKIHRLELERSDAETDMRHLASETARFRQLLNKNEEKLRDFDEPKKSARGNQNRKQESPRSGGALKPSPDTRTHAVSSTSTRPPATAPSWSYPSAVGDSGHTTPKAMEVALASAETRCTILEKQLAYMRTLLETAERDRNEAQRRSRSRGEQLLAWRHEAEAHLRGLEEELRAERRRNRLLCENAESVRSKLGRSMSDQQQPRRKTEEEELEEEHEEEHEDSEEDGEDCHDDKWASFHQDHQSFPGQENGLLCASTPMVKVAEASTVKRRGQPNGKSSTSKTTPATNGRARHDSGREKAAGSVPFVVGRSVGPSHNVNVNLQTVLSMLSKKGNVSSGGQCSAEKMGSSCSTRRQRQARNQQVDHQMQQDVSVVLEELVDEFDQLCREHQALVRRLAEASEASEKTLLEQRLSDLVNRMEVKGQQIGRLRSYIASMGVPEVTGAGKSKVEIRTTIEAQPSPPLPPSAAHPPVPTSSNAQTVGGESRRDKSLHLLRTAKRWQACSLEPHDISWR